MGVIHLGLLLNSSYPTQPHSLIADYSPPSHKSWSEKNRVSHTFCRIYRCFFMSLPVFLYHWLAGLLSQCQPTFLLFVKQGAKVARWWEHSPPTNVAQVQILVSRPYVGWVCCWFSPNAPRGFSPGTPVFPPPQKPTFPNPIRPGIRRRTTMWMWYLQIVIYLFSLFISSVWQFIGGRGSARTDKPFIPCVLWWL